MKDGVLPRITQRQRDKLTAKRLFAASAFVGSAFALWVLSTPIHQVYWAAQARLAEAKSTVFQPGFTDSDSKVWWYQILATPAQPFTNTNSVHPGQHQQHRDSASAPASGSRYLSLLVRQAQQKLKPLWSSGDSNLHSGQDDLLVNGTKHESGPSNVTAFGISTPDPSDLQHVMQEAEQLGFEAAVFSSRLNPTAAQQQSLAADARLQTNDLSHALTHAPQDAAPHEATPDPSLAPTPLLLQTQDDDHVQLNHAAAVEEAQGEGAHVNNSSSLGQVPKKPSKGKLQMSEQQYAADLDADAVHSHAVGSQGVVTTTARTEDEQTGSTLTMPESEEVGEADPSKHYSQEDAILEPAESLSSQMHREEEAHRAAAALSAEPAAAEDYKLTKEMVAKVAANGTVMVTWANFHYLDFTLNWVQHVQAANISAYLVGAMDNELLQALLQRNISCFGMESGLSIGDFGWGSQEFHKMGREKIGLVLAFTEMGFDVVVSDVDTVWLQDPGPFLAHYPEADILVSSDSLHATTLDGGLEMYPGAGTANIGIMLFRTAAKVFAEEWNQALLANDDYWDQNAFNDLMNRGAKFTQQRSDRLFLGYDGKLTIGILPVSTFCSGHTFFVQRMADAMGLKPYVVHATFQFSGTPGKRHRMRESLLWNADPPEYFRPTGGLLSWDMQLHDLVEKSAPHQQVVHSVNNSQAVPRQRSMTLDEDKMGHFRLVNAQIQQVRTAMAIANSLRRVLIIPQLWCGMDRWWAPHDGNIPGSSLQLPFPCPLDHIFDLEQMISSHEPALGPYIDWREHSLFNNSQFPQEDFAQATHIHVCQGGESDCDDGSKQSAAVKPGNSIRLQANLTDQQIQTALKGFADVPVIHFDTMSGAFGGHAHFGDASRFQRRTEVYTSLWCCVDKHPGHVWYDMWWDHLPHEDRHKRQITEPWKPSTGP
ncbi:hypothetical protein ABBQ32_005185 [Trebouxia sp. C0010 RCD-2024]